MSLNTAVSKEVIAFKHVAKGTRFFIKDQKGNKKFYRKVAGQKVVSIDPDTYRGDTANPKAFEFRNTRCHIV
jgi:hypothetical protein